MDQQQIIDVSGTRLTTSDVAAVARDNFAVRLSQEPDIRKKILASRELLEEKLRRGEIIYGVNTGLGGNAENSLKESRCVRNLDEIRERLGEKFAQPEENHPPCRCRHPNSLFPPLSRRGSVRFWRL
ncbi:MAG TPA: aromatic amino acid lyase [Candidatus Binatia bacterium]